MCNFIKIDSLNSVKLTSRWVDSKKFLSRGKLVNKNNEFVKITYPGPMYIIALKKERQFTAMERIFSITKFIFFNLLTLGLCNFKKSFRELATKDKVVCRYAVRYNIAQVDMEEYLKRYTTPKTASPTKENEMQESLIKSTI